MIDKTVMTFVDYVEQFLKVYDAIQKLPAIFLKHLVSSLKDKSPLTAW